MPEFYFQTIQSGSGSGSCSEKQVRNCCVKLWWANALRWSLPFELSAAKLVHDVAMLWGNAVFLWARPLVCARCSFYYRNEDSVAGPHDFTGSSEGQGLTRVRQDRRVSSCPHTVWLGARICVSGRLCMYGWVAPDFASKTASSFERWDPGRPSCTLSLRV